MQTNGQKKVPVAEPQSAAAHEPTAAALRRPSALAQGQADSHTPPSASHPAPSSLADSMQSATPADQAGGGQQFASPPLPPVEPLGPLAFHVPRQPTASARHKRLGSSEKHALAGGFFVMFALALAFAIGWWMTPSSPSDFSVDSITRETPVREIRPDVDMPVLSSEEEADSYGSSEVTTNSIDVESQPVEEISVLPSAPVAGASSQKKEAAAAPPAAAQSANARSSASSGKSNTGADKAVDREEELQRLKAQAYSETQKDRLGSTPPAKPASGSGAGSQSSSREGAASVKRVDLSQAVAECDNEVGLFYRERCKWRLCNGRWGKYGCPSYQHDSRAPWNVS